jgi:hypothetical protein
MNESDIKAGFVYHIKNSYFDTVKDDKLMRNHEGGAYRPTYFCIKDEKTGLLWVIPMSLRVGKYQAIVDKDTKRHGACLKIHIGEYANRQNAFLFQNMFPILPKYIDHIHLIQLNPVPVSQRLQVILDRNFREVMRLYKLGAKIVFPDITRLEKLMMEELEADNIAEASTDSSTTDTKE